METAQELTIASANPMDSGNYSVLVSDGLYTETSDIAALTVETLRSLRLSWSKPTLRENGEPLPSNEIGGYIIQYGTDRDNLDQFEVLSGADSTNCELSNLASGTLYLRIATVDAQEYSRPILRHTSNRHSIVLR